MTKYYSEIAQLIVTFITCVVLSLLGIAGALFCFRFKYWVKVVLLPFVITVSIAAMLFAAYIGKFLFFGSISEVSKVLPSGLQYTREIILDEKAVVHWIKIDLTRFGIIQVGQVTEVKRLNAQLTTQALADSEGLAAINGSFFSPFKDQHIFSYYPHIGDPVTPVGFTKIGKRVVNEAKNDWPLLVISATGEPEIISGADKLHEHDSVYVLAGHSLLLNDGIVTTAKDTEPYPRVSLGLSADKKFAYFFVVDGKQPGYSEGLTLHRLAEYMALRGVFNAIELDGGGSATLAVKSGTKVSLLNRPAHTKLPGRERPVANQLIVIARDPVNQ